MSASDATSRRERWSLGVRRNTMRVTNGARYLRGSTFTPANPTPKDIVWSQGKVQLWRYRSTQRVHGTPVLIMLGLVSRSWLFDLHERASFVRTLRDSGFDVYVLDWGVADAGDAANTLETYVDVYLPRAVKALLNASQADSFSLIGYCMGGNIALMAAAGVPGLPIRSLVTMATGVDWDHMHAQVAPLRRRGGENVEAFLNEDGCVPGELLAYFFKVRKPTAGLVEYASLWQNLWDTPYVAGHQAIARWARESVPLPGGVARQMLDSWLRENAFATGQLRLHGRHIDLAAITCPVLAVLTKRDEIVPPAASRPIVDLLTSTPVELLELDAGHVGLIVGRSAHQVMYPRLIDWLVDMDAPPPSTKVTARD